MYYDSFEQSLGLENRAAMLKTGGILLTDDRLPEARGASTRLAGVTDVRYEAAALSGRQPVGWYPSNKRVRVADSKCWITLAHLIVSRSSLTTSAASSPIRRTPPRMLTGEPCK